VLVEARWVGKRDCDPLLHEVNGDEIRTPDSMEPCDREQWNLYSYLCGYLDPSMESDADRSRLGYNQSSSNGNVPKGLFSKRRCPNIILKRLE